MKKAVVYARHITYRKYEKNIQEQFDMADEFAKENKFKIVDRYFDLCNNKQKTYLAYEELKKDCKRKKFEYILICTPLALGRDITKIEQWKLSIQKYGIKVLRVYCQNSIYEDMLNDIIELVIKELELKGK